MGRSSIAVLATACALAPSVAASITDAGSPVAENLSLYVPREAIVRFEPGTSSADRRDARRKARVDFDSSLGLPRAQVVEVDGSVGAAVRRLERQPGVAYAQPNYRYEALAAPLPNDTFFDKLWGLSDPALPDPGVSALEAWESNQGNGQVIAVVDTGVDLTHPDIVGNLWSNPNPDPVAQDLHGYDFVDDDGIPDDYNFHGTHVAATAAATADNNQGIAGVAPEAQIMAVRVLDGDGSGSTADVAAGIVYAADHGTDVINLSLGGPAGAGDQAMSDAIDVAVAADAVVVAAAGNEGVSNDVDPHTPCALPQANLICVAALNQSGSLAGFSNFGAKSVDLAAPGTSILSAKTDYGPPLFSDDFESGLGALWTTQAFGGGVPWGLSSSAASGEWSATDSPGQDYGYTSDATITAESDLFTTAAVDLTGERGCRIHFRTKYEIEPPGSDGTLFDAFFAGAAAQGPSFDVRAFAGTSWGYPNGFVGEEVSVSDLDNRSDVQPFFAVLSNELLELDGAYVDDVRLFCRDETYIDGTVTFSEYDQPDAGSYVRFQGTSMATPHVSGVAALVRSAAPEAGATQIVSAILAGTSETPNLNPAKPTATTGIADACQAIAVATGGGVATDCPGSSEHAIQQPPPEPGPAPSGGSVAEVGTASVSDRTPPRTFFRKRPRKVIRTRYRKARVVFRFRSNEKAVVFICKVDRGLLRFCKNRIVRRFGVGKRVVRVKALDAAGNVDRTPAVYRFRVKRRRGHR